MNDVMHAVSRSRQLSVWHAVSVCVGMVIGAGIFSTTPMAAANVSSSGALLLAWAFGGAMSLAGALCFAEMAAAFPDAGGDYYFLYKAYGPRLGFLFAWSRFAVIHTGSMAMLAFVFGDYLGQVIHLGAHGSADLCRADRRAAGRRQPGGHTLRHPYPGGADERGAVRPRQCRCRRRCDQLARACRRRMPPICRARRQ